MREVGETIMKKAQYAARKISKIPCVRLTFSSPMFKEFVVDFNETGQTVKSINQSLLEKDIFGGKDLSTDFPELGQSALYCVTEVHSKEEIDELVQCLQQAVKVKQTAGRKDGEQ
jgi:glycine dehydrogenase subunit 1